MKNSLVSLLSAALATGFLPSASGQVSDPPVYHVVEEIPLSPLGLTPIAVAMNKDGWVIINEAGVAVQRQPLLYKNGQLQLISMTGAPANYVRCTVAGMSDARVDGSILVTGSIQEADGKSRPIIWTIAADNQTSLRTLPNIILPDDGTNHFPGEQAAGGGLRINKAGFLVGYSAVGNGFAATRWAEPDYTTAHLIFPESAGTIGALSESGAIVLNDTAQAGDLPSGNRVVGDAEKRYTNPDPFRPILQIATPFVWEIGALDLTELPYPAGLTNLNNARVAGINASGDIVGSVLGEAGFRNVLWKRAADESGWAKHRRTRLHGRCVAHVRGPRWPRLYSSRLLTAFDPATIAGHALQSTGVNASSAIVDPAHVNKIRQFTTESRFTNIGGADFIQMRNGAVLIPLGGGRIVAQGGGNLIANDGGTLIANDGGTIVASGGGNLITFANLIGHDGGSLGSQTGAQILSNLVAQGGGNLVASGGGNILADNSSSLISPDHARAIAISPSGIVASGGGNVISDKASGFVR